MSQEAVEAEIHDYLAMNGGKTVPCYKLALFGQKHNVHNARLLNDLVPRVYASLFENVA